MKQDIGLLELGEGRSRYRAVEAIVKPFLKDWQIYPDLATAQLRTLARQKRGRPAFQVCQVMRKHQVAPQTAHYNQVLKACRTSPWHLSLELLKDMIYDKVYPDEHTVKQAMDNCCDRWRSVLKLFEYFRRMPGLELASFRNAMGTLLEKPTRWREALKLWEDMSTMKIVPDSLCWSHAIKWYGLSGAWEESLQIFEQAQRVSAAKPSLPFSGALFAMCRSLQWEASLHILSRMNAQEMDLSKHDYRELVLSCVKCEQWQFSVRFLKEMVEEDLDPDRSFSTMAAELVQRRIAARQATAAEQSQSGDRKSVV